MAAVTTELKVLVKAVGKGEVDKLSKSLNDLGSKAAAPACPLGTMPNPSSSKRVVIVKQSYKKVISTS